MPDHFDDQYAPVPALMAVANATSTLRIGALVHCNDYKHPVVFAKEAGDPRPSFRGKARARDGSRLDAEVTTSIPASPTTRLL